MRGEKWDMYIETLQGHPSVCSSSHTIESMEFIKEYLPPDKFPKMLNIGAGEGLETKILNDLGYNAVGVIRGQTNWDFAKKNFPDVSFVDCDMHDLPFRSDSFDAMYLNQTFEHAFAPFFLLLEMYCVLRAGGRAWIAMPEFKEVNDPTAHKDINLIGYHHPNIICWNLMGQFFKKTGFKVLYKKPVGKDPYFDNPYLLEKQPIGCLHPNVQMAVNKRKEMFG